MAEPGTITKPEIQTELGDRQKALDAQIDHLDRWITDLTSHKLPLENANRQIEKLAAVEQDPGKRGNLRHPALHRARSRPLSPIRGSSCGHLLARRDPP